jgi:hypothetical protein
MRYGGSSLHFRHVLPLKQLSPAEQLIAALLRDDAVTARQIIEANRKDPVWHLQILDSVYDDSLFGLIWDRVCAMGLHDLVSEVGKSTEVDVSKLTKKRHQNWCHASLAATLKQFSLTELLTFENYDQHFVELLDYLNQSGFEVVWYKGLVLARTLYAQPHFRLSSDFDILLKPAELASFIECMSHVGYAPITGDAGFSHQIGVGPTSSVEDFFIAPSQQFVPASVVGLSHEQLPLIDLKFDPLERGIKMVELERFYSDLVRVSWREQSFLAPSPMDHMMMCLSHLAKDRFYGWKWLNDIDVMVKSMNEDAASWREFTRRCHIEAIADNCWAGLALAVERLQTPVPQPVIEELQPRSLLPLKRYFLFTVNPLFTWNGSGLPMLCLNAAIAEDRSRKFDILRQSIFPPAPFLTRYYAGGKKVSWWQTTLLWILHIFVLVLPAGTVRRSFGKFIWPEKRFMAAPENTLTKQP